MLSKIVEGLSRHGVSENGEDPKTMLGVNMMIN